jgi:dipeptidase D
MASALEGLEPKAVWKHFEAIAAIPRASKKEAAIREYVVGVAKRLGLDATVDPVGNVIVRKPARPGREKAPMAALQGHLDMVCEKNEGTAFDFDKDGIKLVRKGDWLHADGTTLGSDNGVGVASGLAIMESTDVNHGPLEFVFTIDEETGLTGASEFGSNVLKSKYFLNLDNEEKGTICIGCAGGINTKGHLKITRRAPKFGGAARIKVFGLKGGHSGVDIHQGRGNAVRILGRVLRTLIDKPGIEVAELKGGSAHNAIPREASAIVTFDPKSEAQVKSIVAGLQSDIRAELGEFDPELNITVESAAKPSQVIDTADATKIADVLITLHHGVLAMSPDIPGLVQTSTNVATVTMDGDMVEIGTSQRSSIESSKNAIERIISTQFKMAGFEVTNGSGYPGWKPEPNSELVKTARAVHEKVLGNDPKLIAMHAGLECGVIGEKNPGMQMISFGPQIENPHSPNERCEIPSVESFYKYLKALLESI